MLVNYVQSHNSEFKFPKMRELKINFFFCFNNDKTVPTPGDLKSHMYVHNGSWPFKCSICNRGFSKQTNLRNHVSY
ncbi:hypothetical protein BLA29_004021 [Euroglyphus maynei]|uniref:C2H2-type domain-containing protein n=1 Tax=Euroglyphus maynei TaxID=6958 RepID=A0A1Y3ASM3_EURMA|nr:hypothetical protein BLA29_004021 [Euroglyphus maynei]